MAPKNQTTKIKKEIRKPNKFLQRYTPVFTTSPLKSGCSLTELWEFWTRDLYCIIAHWRYWHFPDDFTCYISTDWKASYDIYQPTETFHMSYLNQLKGYTCHISADWNVSHVISQPTETFHMSYLSRLKGFTPFHISNTWNVSRVISQPTEKISHVKCQPTERFYMLYTCRLKGFTSCHI